MWPSSRALCLTVLLSVMAFVLETGALYVTRNEYQNAAEAAAMAGALELCGEDPVQAARDIAVANGCPDTDALSVQLGFYDELGEYADFTEFRDFEADPDPDTPSINEGVPKNSDGDYHFNNAVLVTVNESRSSLTGILTDEEVRNVAAASAYLVRYGIIAGEEGMAVNPTFRSGYPLLKDTSVHANGDIAFHGTESASGDVRISATGTILGCPLPFENHADEVEIQPLDDVMEELRNRAEDQGTLIDTSAWPADDTWHTAAFGRYKRSFETISGFSLRDGDHDGAVYFLASGSPGSPSGLQELRIIPDKDCNTIHEAWNFIVATDVPQLFLQQQSPTYTEPSTTLGGVGEDMAAIYSSGTIAFYDKYSHGRSRSYVCNGVFFRAKKFDSKWNTQASWDPGPQKMRILAEEILFNGSSGNPTIDATFGPPCPPCIVRLGALEPVLD